MLENYQSPWMDEELVIMRDAVRKFLDKEFVPLAEKWDKQGFVDRDAWYKAGEAGILCASISEEYGGGGGDDGGRSLSLSLSHTHTHTL